MNWWPVGLLLCCLVGARAGAATEGKTPSALTPEQLGFFENKIRPILSDRCYECHSATAKKIKGGLLLDSRDGVLKGGETGPAIVPGDPEHSLLIKAIRRVDDDLKMPPKNPLTPAQVADFEMWVKMGAPDPREKSNQVAGSQKPPTFAEGRKFWSFQPTKDYPPPEVKETSWPKNPIDNFVLAKLEEKGMAHAPHADKRILIRRAYFDLLGLPPTPEQVEKFIQDKSPDAYEKLVDELLNSKHYGERWGRHWLDIARYADSGGYETDIYYRNAWRYRDYVVKSFNDDKPYDQFVKEQVAADEIWPDNLDLDGSYDVPKDKQTHLEARIGTGLYTLGPQVHESNMDAQKLGYEKRTDWADTTSAVFMGLTMGCARCHDHKFDPISQHDYYALQAVFAASKEVEMPLVTGMGIADFKQSYPRILEVEEARTAYQLFEEKVKGRDLTQAEKDQKRTLRDSIAQKVLELPQGTAHDGAYVGLMEVPTATVLGHEDPPLIPEVKILNRGDLKRAKETVLPDLPEILREATDWKTPMPTPYGSRKELALWLTAPNHPLTARVMANRIWQWHFGRGIVATPNDFGKMGELPTHPELLDWLARKFISDGWSIKKIHRLIMLSSTYQMASLFQDTDNSRKDPDNHYLWRMNRQRLEAEELWDSLHATAGTLNLQMGGRPVVPPLDGDELVGSKAWPVSSDPKQQNRRGLYIVNFRDFRFPIFDVFDSPVNFASAATRDVTTVAPQALWLLNNKIAFREAREFAARLVKEAGDGWNKMDFGIGQFGWAGNKAGPWAGWARLGGKEEAQSDSRFDTPSGAVVTHGPTSVLWKAPTNEGSGQARISGGLWNIRHLGRSGTWRLWKNDTQKLAEGTIDDASGTSAKPLDLASGNGDASALQNIAYAPGDTFRLELLEIDYVAVKLAITARKMTHDLSQEFSLESNPSPVGWQYSEAIANGGGTVGAVTHQFYPSDFGPGLAGWQGKSASPWAGWAQMKGGDDHRSGPPLTPGFDDPAGIVVTHGPTSVVWKTPEGDPGGVGSISGGLWNLRHKGRHGSWKLWKNDQQVLAEGDINDSSGSSAKPLPLAGATNVSLESIPYAAGDSFRLEILEEDYVGVNLTIKAAKTHDLAREFDLQSNPSPKGWQYGESLADGGGAVGAMIDPRNYNGSLGHWVDEAWRIALSRAPSQSEEESAIDLIQKLAGTPAPEKHEDDQVGALAALPAPQALAMSKFCLALFNLNEFIYVE